MYFRLVLVCLIVYHNKQLLIFLNLFLTLFFRETDCNQSQNYLRFGFKIKDFNKDHKCNI